MFKKVKATTRPRPEPPGRQPVNSGILYECKRCGKTFISNINQDGSNCDECKGSLKPLGYVDELQNGIRKMKDKIENAETYMLNKKNKAREVTIKINLDTTEFENKLDRIEKKLERINSLEVASRLSEVTLRSADATLELEKALNKVKELL